MIYWVAFALLALAAYLLPGYTFLSCVRLDGVGRIGRLFLALPTSLVIVPFLLVGVSGFWPFVPALWQLIAISILFAACSWILREKGWLPQLNVLPRNRDSFPGSRLEWLLVMGFCLLYAVGTSLPRLDAFVQGDLASTVGPSDAAWQLARAVSIARSGLPPGYYFLPDLKLAYYYWSGVYPAVLSNQPLLSVSLARAVSVATCLQTAAFLMVFYLLLRLNFRTIAARVGGLVFTTLVGGYDYFAGMGSREADREWWQTHVHWIANGFQISSPITWFIWVPQHVAGAMAFVISLLIWRNVRGHNLVRAAAIGLLLSFAVGTSAYVFLSMAIALAVWFWLHRGWRLWRRGVPLAGTGLAVFALGSWKQILLEHASATGLAPANFRVPLLEAYLGAGGRLDHLLTLVTAPVVVSWVFLIEMGLPFVLYLWFVVRQAFGRNAWERFLAVFPLVCLLLILVVRSSDETNNLVMRGIIPAQICIVLAAVAVIDRANWRGFRPGRTALLWYLGLTIVLVQCVWPFEELRWLSAPALGAVLGVKNDVRVGGLVVAQPANWPDGLSYIHWANEHTSPGAVFVEGGLSKEQGDLEFMYLERLRFLPAQAIRKSADPASDVSLSQLATLASRLGKQSLLCQAVRSPYVAAHGPSLYYVSRAGLVPSMGSPVYQDQYVRVYVVSASVREACGGI